MRFYLKKKEVTLKIIKKKESFFHVLGSFIWHIYCTYFKVSIQNIRYLILL